MMRNIVVVAFIMLIFAPFASLAQIAPGMQLTGGMDEVLDSGSAQVGDLFTVSKVHSESNEVDDATIYGHVVAVTRAGQGRPGSIQLAWDKLRLASGDVYSMAGADTVSAQITTKSNALKEAGGAIIGGVVGRIAGHAVGQTLAGTVVGTAAGYTIAKNNRTNVSIPKDATVTVQVNRSLPREQAQ
jgi:hypothetical protein